MLSQDIKYILQTSFGGSVLNFFFFLISSFSAFVAVGAGEQQAPKEYCEALLNNLATDGTEADPTLSRFLSLEATRIRPCSAHGESCQVRLSPDRVFIVH